MGEKSERVHSLALLAPYHYLFSALLRVVNEEDADEHAHRSCFTHAHVVGAACTAIPKYDFNKIHKLI